MQSYKQYSIIISKAIRNTRHTDIKNRVRQWYNTVKGTIAKFKHVIRPYSRNAIHFRVTNWTQFSVSHRLCEVADRVNRVGTTSTKLYINCK